MTTHTPCIVWNGSINRSTGYGQIMRNGKYSLAHRIAWERERGPIPEGLVIDHLCRNRACVNVAHMEVVTHKENILRGVGPSAVNARKTHCVNGHSLLDPATSYASKTRGRVCRECQHTNWLRYVEQRKAAGLPVGSEAAHAKRIAKDRAYRQRPEVKERARQSWHQRAAISRATGEQHG